MGIKDLRPFLKSKGVVKKTDISEFQGKIIAIDAMNYLHKYMKTSERWLEGLMFFICKFRSNYIKSVFIFDGKNIEGKEIEWKRRKKLRDYLERRLETETDKQVKDRIALQLTPVTEESIEKFKEALSILGISWITADGEGEQLACSLCRNGYVDAVLSEDCDCYPLKCPLTLFNRKGDSIDYILYSDILPALKMNDDQFLDLCILTGCDYNKRVKELGPARAFKCLLKYGCIETILENPNDKELSNCPKKFNGQSMEIDSVCLNYIQCRNIFKRQTPIIEIPLNKKIKTTALQNFILTNFLKIDINYIIKHFSIVKFED
jgi:flap endonuclease-1